MAVVETVGICTQMQLLSSPPDELDLSPECQVAKVSEKTECVERYPVTGVGTAHNILLGERNSEKRRESIFPT